MPEAPAALLLALVVLTGLYLSNLAYDAGLKNYLSRKMGHLVGGCAYLIAALLFSNPWWPLAVSALFTTLLLGARAFSPGAFRGVGGAARSHAFAEVYFPAMGTASLAVGWAWLGDRWLATVPILFMAWGDCVTGLLRARFYGREVKGSIGSLGMLGVCLLVASLYSTYWVGAVGAAVATAAERWTPLSRGLWDDNWTIIASSLLVMGLLRQL